MNPFQSIDEQVLAGPWFVPRSQGWVAAGTIALKLKLEEGDVAVALRRLHEQGLLDHYKDTEDGPTYKAKKELWVAREKLIRSRGQRHRALVDARPADLERLIIGLAMAQVIEDNRHTRGFSGGHWRTMVELEVYLLGFQFAEIQSCCDKLVEERVLERLPDGHVQLTARGTQRYERTVQGELGLADGDSLLDPPGKRFVFISYDTRESLLAEWLKQVITERVPTNIRVFVALRDIDAGDDPMRVMLEQNLLKAEALLALCSKRSVTSPWIWWESAAVWARDGLVVPLFFDVTPNEFKGPLTIVRQGRSVVDLAEVLGVVTKVVRLFLGDASVAAFTTAERDAFERALAECRKPVPEDDTDPTRRALRQTSRATKIFVQPIAERNADDIFHIEKVEQDHVTLAKESNDSRVNIPLAFVASFTKRSPYADDMMLSMRDSARLVFDGANWKFRLVAQ